MFTSVHTHYLLWTTQETALLKTRHMESFNFSTSAIFSYLHVFKNPEIAFKVEKLCGLFSSFHNSENDLIYFSQSLQKKKKITFGLKPSMENFTTKG